MAGVGHEDSAPDPGMPRDQRAHEAALLFIDHELEAIDAADCARLAVLGRERAEGDRLADCDNPVRLRLVALIDTLVVGRPGKRLARQRADNLYFIVFDNAPGTMGKL